MKPEVFNLREADDPQKLIHQAVERLTQGGLVAFPTETVYGVAASVMHPAAVERLANLKSRGDKPLALAFAGLREVREFIPAMSPMAERLSRRCWPGPVTIVLPVAGDNAPSRKLDDSVWQRVAPTGTLGARVPAHRLTAECLRALGSPVVLTSANGKGDPAAVDGAEVVETLGDSIDLVLDEGPCRYGQPSTVIQVGNSDWKILREGIVSEAAIDRLARCVVLFVCTGNTCRSPMAEAICKSLIAKRLSCRIDQIGDHGYEVLSAGVAAAPGAAASREAIVAMSEIGADLNDHFSQPLTREVTYQADYIFVMTDGHYRLVTSMVPEAAHRVFMLRKDNANVPDPVGMDLTAYRHTAQNLLENLELIVADLVP